MKKYFLLIYIYFLILSPCFANNSPFISEEIDKQFINDLTGTLPKIGDVTTVRDILVAIYNGNYETAITILTLYKLEDKLTDFLSALNPLLTAAKAEYYVINYYKQKLDQRIFEDLINIYKNLCPAVKKEVLRGNLETAKDILRWRIYEYYKTKEKWYQQILGGYATRREKVLEEAVTFIRDIERQKKAFEKLRKRAKRIIRARLYAKCVFSFEFPPEANILMKQVRLVVKKKSKEGVKKVYEDTVLETTVLTLKRLMSGEAYKIEYIPSKSEYFEGGSIELTDKDIPLANKVMSMVYKKFRIKIKAKPAFKEYLKKLEEEKKREELKKKEERKYEYKYGYDPWPEAMAYRDKLVREYENLLEEFKEGAITFRKFEEKAISGKYYGENRIIPIVHKLEYPPSGICPHHTKEEAIYFGSYFDYVKWMKEHGKKPDYGEWFEKRKEIESKYKKICESREKQWKEFYESFVERVKQDIKEIEERAEELFTVYDLDRKKLNAEIKKLSEDFNREFYSKKRELDKLYKQYQQAPDYERLDIAEEGYNLCHEIKDLFEEKTDEYYFIVDKWKEKAYEVLDSKNIGFLSASKYYNFYYVDSIEELQAKVEQYINGHISKPEFLSPHTGIRYFIEDIYNLWEGIYRNETNLYKAYNGIYPSQLYSFCKENLPKIEKIRKNILDFEHLKFLKAKILHFKKHNRIWEMHTILPDLKELIHLLDTSSEIIGPLKKQVNLFKIAKRYRSRSSLTILAFNGEQRRIVERFFFIIDQLPLQSEDLNPSIFDQIINEIKAQTNDVVKLYIKEKKYIPKLREAASNYYRLEKLSQNVDKNWKEILELNDYFKSLSSKSYLLQSLKKDTDKLLMSISNELNIVLQKKYKDLQSLLSKVKQTNDKKTLNELYGEYIDELLFFKEDYSFPSYKQIKNLLREIQKEFTKKFQKIKIKKAEKEFEKEIAKLKEQKIEIERNVKVSPIKADLILPQFLNQIESIENEIEKFLDKYPSSKIEALLKELLRWKNWAENLAEHIQKLQKLHYLETHSREAIMELYAEFARCYMDKNLPCILELISENWSAPDGTTIDEMEEILENSFDVFDRIEYKIKNFRIEPEKNGKFKVYYENEIIGYIFSENITHKESYKVVEEVGIKDGKVKILKTLQGQFWKR